MSMNFSSGKLGTSLTLATAAAAPPVPAAPAKNQNSSTLDPVADRVSMEALAQGASPSVALKAAKAASGQKNLTYRPHTGARQIARALKRSLVNSIG